MSFHVVYEMNELMAVREAHFALFGTHFDILCKNFNVG